MKYIDINRKFTETVSSYIAQGYIINTASMSGSQGEIAHIDLTDGKQIVRVLLDSFTEWEDYNQLEGLKLVVGIAADNVKPNDNQRCDVIWNNRLDVISCEKFYKLSSNRDDSVFYGTREEATAADEKRFERYCRRDCRLELVQLPDELDKAHKADAADWFRGNCYLEAYNSPYDCTGQEFTNWFYLFRRRGHWFAYHSVSRDV